MKDKIIKLTTSQFAKLHNLNKRTLHYYDEIRLFSPKFKGDNNYRYYDYMQSIELENILMLKELNMSINDIKNYINNPNSNDFINIANIKIRDIEKQIKQLKKSKDILNLKKQQLRLCDKINNYEINIIDCNEEYLLITPYDFVDYDIEILLEHLKKVWDIEQYRIGCGSFISVSKILKREFEKYDGIFTQIKKKVNSKNCISKPRGKYICGYAKGDWHIIPTLYNKILSFADSNNLTLTGFAYETGLNEFAISNMDDYVTQVMIKIKTTET